VKLFLDEDSSVSLLATLLRKAGHDVQTTHEQGRTGATDPAQLLYAIRQGCVLLTRNHEDFEVLHDLVREAGGHHPGILVTRYDNDATRDFTPRGVVVALIKFEASGIEVRDELHVLNH
jgi:predicted nuclease of predicted toxin-antitoxin system